VATFPTAVRSGLTLDRDVLVDQVGHTQLLREQHRDR
jgi:hypothetical protein